MLKQVFLDYKKGEVKLVEVPAPKVKPNGVIVRTLYSVISLGTESLMISLAKKSLIGKAIERPDLLKQALDFAKNEGLLNAYRLAMTKLSEPSPMGYSSVGIIEEVGQNAEDEFKVNDLVACAGHGYACHAELTYVPKTLCVKVPEGVKPIHAAFANIGAIALHSVRLAEPGIGSRIVVIGLGLLGQLTVQIAKAAGCNVFGIDIVSQKVELAKTLGAEAGAVVGQEDIKAKVEAWAPQGADSVIIFASTKSSQPIELAAKIAREKGKIVVPGWVRLKLPRHYFYEKELELIVPRSSGPGLYDSKYESGQLDYPYTYVRWTVKRNMEAFLQLIKENKVKLDPLITHVFDFEKAESVYKQIYEHKLKGAIGVVFKYKAKYKKLKPVIIEITPRAKKTKRDKDKIVVGFIGAGQHAQSVLLPILKKMREIEFKIVCTARPLTATQVAKRWRFQYATTDFHKVLEDPDIDVVFITTRHDTHAYFTSEALKSGKYVFVEKPLAMNCSELAQVIKAYRKNPGKLMVGFNRRYSPLIQQAKSYLSKRIEPLMLFIRINAGYTPLDSWIFDPIQGGGRIIGELCHFIDLALYLSDSIPMLVYAKNTENDKKYHFTDNVAVIMKHKDGSISNIFYSSKGIRKYSRERIEMYCQESVVIIDNFRNLEIIGKERKSSIKLMNSDRGHKNELKLLIESIKRDQSLPIDINDYIYTTITTFAIHDSLKCGQEKVLQEYIKKYHYSNLL